MARIVRTGFEYEIMEDIKNGKFSQFLVQPLGYFPYRLCCYFGQKLAGLGMILGILAVVLAGLGALGILSLEFYRVLAFLATLVLAVTLNFLIFYCFSSVAFWIIEIGFLFEGIRIVTILLSGGIFPLEVFGTRFLQVMAWLPFKYTVSYPINVLSGKISTGEMAQGVLVQCVWIAACLAIAVVLIVLGVIGLALTVAYLQSTSDAVRQYDALCQYTEENGIEAARLVAGPRVNVASPRGRRR